MKTINPKKMVCVFAHPDDEAFGPGGAIAHFSKTCDVSVICVTNGDADKKFSKGYNTKELGKIRREELKTSAKILGVKQVYFLDFKDGSLCNNNYHEVAKGVEAILKTIKPDTLMTFDGNGVSGHLDHIAVSMETTYLFERLSYVKNLMYFCEKREVKKLIGKKYFVYFPEGYTKEEVNMILDVTPYFKDKVAAMKAHKSQRSDAIWILTVFRRFIKTEYFRIMSK